MSMSAAAMQSLLSGSMNSKLSSSIYGASGQDESRGVPNSTRRAFESGMRADAVTSRMSAQNMRDGMAFVEIAQTSVTAIKSILQEMQELANEGAGFDNLSPEQYEGITRQMETHAKRIVELSNGIHANGFSLLNGTAGTNGVIQLQAGTSLDQKFTNMVDSGAGDEVLFEGKVNMNNLEGKAGMTNQTDAEGVREMLDKVVSYVESVESQYSYDYKALENLSVLHDNNADIFDGTADRDLIDPEADSRSGAAAPPTDSREYLDYLLATLGAPGGILNDTR